MAQERKIALNEVESELDNRISGTDAVRAKEMERLQNVRRAKANVLQREHARLSGKLGTDHPRVLALANQIRVNRGLQRDLVLETERAKTELPSVTAESWAVHGFVRDKELKGIPNLTIALYDPKGVWIRELGYACTDDKGYFRLESGNIKNLAASQAYLRVLNSQSRPLYMDKNPLTPVAGRIDYREIRLEDVTACTPPESVPAPPPGKDEGQEKTRYLGNSSKREIHDLNNEKPQCQISEIRPDHRVSFKTEGEAIAAGYDYCAYCFGKEKSKR